MRMSEKCRNNNNNNKNKHNNNSDNPLAFSRTDGGKNDRILSTCTARNVENKYRLKRNLKSTVAYLLEIPVLAQSLKSSNIELGLYLDGRQFKCCMSATAVIPRAV